MVVKVVVPGFRVIVCGGRDYDDVETLNRILDTYFEEYLDHHSVGGQEVWPCLVHGGASGADRLADEWSLGKDMIADVFLPDWALHGRAAGPIRNQEMADSGADLCIAFPGGRGTADMVKRARAAGIPVVRVDVHGFAHDDREAREGPHTTGA